MFIQRNIVNTIILKLVVERLKGSYKPDQVKQMQDHVENEFEKKIIVLKKEFGVTNKTELELALNKIGTTLQNVKDNFILETLAKEYVGAKSERPGPIERPDLVAYYQSHPDEFKTSAKVKWQEIKIADSRDGKPVSAKKRTEQAMAELRRNASFEEVAKKYTGGPVTGIADDWMEPGSLSDEKLEEKLFGMPLEEPQIYTRSGKSSAGDQYSIIQVSERVDAGRRPFEEVQDEIRDKIRQEQMANKPNKFLEEIYSTALIETKYELPPFLKKH
jgi:parvulin-like peptidyl-prolyl isomerase